MNKYIYHILLVIMTFVTTCTFSSCSEESFDENSNGYGKLKFEAILPGSNGTSTRTVYVQDQYGKLKSGWESNDRISVYGFASGTYTFTNPDIDESSDYISRWGNFDVEYHKGENLVAVYPASTITNGVVEMDFSNQDGTLENLKNYDLMVSDKVPYEQAEVKFQMVRKNVFLRIEVQKSKYRNDPSNITVTITGTAGLNKVSFNLNNNTYNLNGTSTNISFTNTRSNVPESDGYYLFYVAVPCIQNIVPITRIEIKKVIRNEYNREQTISDSKSYSNLEMKPGYIYSTRLANVAYPVEKALLKYGRDVNSAISELVGGAGNVKKIIFEVNSSKKISEYSKYKDLHFDFLGFSANLYAIHEGNGVVVIFTPGSVIYYSNEPYGMFKNFNNLNEIENLAIVKMDDGSFAQDIRDLSEMFYGCKSLKSIDLSSFVVNSVGDFTSMFEGCSSLTSLDLSSFNTANEMSEVVRGYMKLKYDYNAIIGLFLSIYKNMNRMFADCSNIKELNLGENFDLTYFYTDPTWNRTSNDWIIDSFVGTPNNIDIKTTKLIKNQFTNSQIYSRMGLTDKKINWINVVTGQPLQ